MIAKRSSSLICCLVLSVAAISVGCAASKNGQSALDPAGEAALRISHLYWSTFWICAVVFVLSAGAAMIPVFRRRAVIEAPDVQPDPARERRRGVVVGTCVGLTVLILFAILIADFVTGRRVHAMNYVEHPLTIWVTGHQWWWEFTYEDPNPSRIVTTANELHLPAGQVVRFELDSADVIHSFWIPNLQGKKDLVPGHRNAHYLRADREGTFWGQCAEFCGYQHAQMRFACVVESPDQFNAWLDAQRQSPPPPSTDLQRRGQEVFMSHTCNTCHTIGGTMAWGTVGPPLTHIASRMTIGAGARPNSMGQLGGWILDPQRIKPGVRMPQHQLPPDDLQALLEYLETLK